MAKIRKTSVIQSTSHAGNEPKVNKYYLLVSARYMRAKYFTVLVLAMFLAVMMIMFRNEITYANLMYLLRDFNTGEAVYASGFDPIEYDEQDNMSYSVYRGELAVIGNRTLRMYNTKGDENRSYEPGYSDPAMVSSDKYLLAYDVGTPSYSLFTSIARVSDAEAEGNIECADVNNRGEFLLVCRSDETKYVVCTYDSSFRPVAKYYKNRYVTSAAMGEDGRVVIASFDSTGAGFDCEIGLYSEGADSPESVYTADGIFPIKCGVWENGGYYVICTDRVLMFNEKGELLKTVESRSGYTSFAADTEALALSSDNDALGGSSSVFVFDTAGELLYNKTINGSVSSLALSGEAVYALAGNEAFMMPLDGGVVLTEEVSDGGAVLLSSGTSAVVCRRNGAEGLIFGDDHAETVTSAAGGTEAITTNIE